MSLWSRSFSLYFKLQAWFSRIKAWSETNKFQWWDCILFCSAWSPYPDNSRRCLTSSFPRERERSDLSKQNIQTGTSTMTEDILLFVMWWGWGYFGFFSDVIFKHKQEMVRVDWLWVVTGWKECVGFCCSWSSQHIKKPSLAALCVVRCGAVGGWRSLYLICHHTSNPHRHQYTCIYRPGEHFDINTWSIQTGFIFLVA